MISIGDFFECADDSTHLAIKYGIVRGDLLVVKKKIDKWDLFQCTVFPSNKIIWLYYLELLTPTFIKLNSQQPTLPIGNQTPLGNDNLFTADQNSYNELSLNEMPDGSFFEKKCECGSAFIGLKHHSSWCPKHGE